MNALYIQNSSYICPMKTQHIIYTGFAQNMSKISNSSVDLVVTSPPYPMIEMWDGIMCNQNAEIRSALDSNNAILAFELMHKELDKVWQECFRVLKDGAIICINIGDATRTMNGKFALYPNHSRIISSLIKIGFTNLPNIIWRKQTNAPNKFMGSGMLPTGAYVTLEHEWILVFRKGDKREFKTAEDKLLRRNNSFFWEERNVWFSDMWEIKGTKQTISNIKDRDRSAAFPLEIPYRLINMYSLQGDTILDPFVGTGTTALAAVMTQRNSIGCEIDADLVAIATDNIISLSIDQANEMIDKRISDHNQFVDERAKKKDIKHFNLNLNMPVITSQETDIKFSYLSEITAEKRNKIVATYIEKSNSSKEELY